MSSYVSTNRLRTHMAGGVVGRGGTATDASGLFAVVHKLGTPTIFGAQIESSATTTSAQWTRQCRVRLSGTVIVIRVTSAGTGVPAPAMSAACRWFAME